LTTTFSFGAVLFWEKFQFADGGDPKDKLLVVLGAKAGHDFLVVLADSFKPKHVTLGWGCNEKLGYYVIAGGGKDFFSKDTVIKLRPLRTNAAELVLRAISREVRVVGNLTPALAAAIRNCLKKTPDISADDAALLQ
jgi:hypothetical protein